MDLQKYNQRLLAILGSMAIIAFGGLILIGGIVLIIEFANDISNQNIQDNSLTIATPVNTEEDVIIRDQEVTFESPILLDTLKTIYLIPVSQVNLEDPEKVRRTEAAYESLSFSKGSRYRYNGSYNNLIIYNQNEDSKDIIFHKKTDISSFQHYQVKDENFLLMYGTNKDTNGDKKLNYEDLKSLFVYNIATKELKEFSFEKMGLANYYVTNDSYEVIIQYTKDKNGNGVIDEYQEPTYLKSLSLDTYQVSDLVAPDMVKEIQGLID